jgi:hypothetical protein
MPKICWILVISQDESPTSLMGICKLSTLATPALGKAAENINKIGGINKSHHIRRGFPASDRPADKEQLLATPLGFSEQLRTSFHEPW